MSDYLPYIIIGLTTGSVYGIAALGLVLTYKTSGIFNFGHGAVAAGAAGVFYELHIRQGWAWPFAAFVAVVVFGLVAGVLLERLAAGLAPVATAYRIIATVALILIVPALFSLRNGPLAVTFPVFLPNNVAFTISGVRVGYDNITTFVLGLIAVTGLYLFFRSSRLGVSMRAVVDRPELLDLTGDSPARVRRISWVIGAAFAGVSGLLLVNTQQQLDIILVSLLVVSAFGAAAFGAFRSLPLAYVGGIVLGVVQGVASKLTTDHTSLAGLDTNMPFLFLFIGLLVLPRHKLVELGQRATRQAARSSQLSRTARTSLTSVALIAAAAVPFVVGTHLATWTIAMAYLPLFLSLGLLVRVSGQISLCQIGFMAIGATTSGHLLANHVPWLIALLVAGLAVVPVGALVAIPAIRLSGLYLGLATLGFGILLAQFFYSKPYMFGSSVSVDAPRPSGFEGDTAFYYLLLVIGLLAAAMVLLIERSRLGRLLRGMADSPTALTMLGTNTNVSRVLVFCASSFLAGISGALYAGVFGSVNKEPFNYVNSLVILCVLMICGRRTLPAAALGTVLLNVPTAYIDGANVSSYLQLGFGATAMLVAVSSGGRFSSWVARLTTRYEDRRTGPAGARAAAPRALDRSVTALP
jgi:ABC-type branched-subunit amino acid transport system permease subunit